EVQSGEQVLIMGPGPIGLMAARLCQLRGVEDIVIVGRSHSKARLKAARQMGATQVIRSDLGEMSSLRTRHFHKALITASPSVIPEIMSFMRFGAIMAFLGIDFGPGGDVKIPMNDFHFSRLQLRASHASPALFFPEVLHLLGSGLISAQPLVSHVFTLNQFAQALKTAAEDKTSAIKVMIQNPELA
ncbi:MAG TPA: zinc-binding dehydrogenase, partial [bacterium]|nr:zinc-binding dehydrogenase [bacterium]